MLKKLFTAHPNEVNETYCQHFKFATKCGSKVAVAGLCCLVHAIFPFLFVTTMSDTVKEMNERIKTRD